MGFPGAYTVDGSEIRRKHQLRLVVYPFIYSFLFIPGGSGFLPSTLGKEKGLLKGHYMTPTQTMHYEGQKSLKFSIYRYMFKKLIPPK